MADTLPSFDAVGQAFDIGALKKQLEGLPAAVRLQRLKELKQSLLEQVTPAVIPPPIGREPGADVGFDQAFTRAGVGRYAEGVTGIPDMLATGAMKLGKAMLEGSALNATPPQMVGQPGTMQATIAGLQTPAWGERVIPGIPTGNDVLAGIDKTGEMAAALKTMNFGQFSPDIGEASRMRSEQMQQSNPVASKLGQGAGDIATLLTVRNPFARGRNAAALAGEIAGLDSETLAVVSKDLLASPEVRKQALAVLAEKANQSQTPLKFIGTVPDLIQTTTQRSGGWQGLMRAAGRPAEAGLEGAVLGVLTDGDPGQNAAYAAGAQAAGGLGLGLIKGMASGRLSAMQNFGLNFSLAALATAGAYQFIKEASPGGEDSPMSSLRAGYSKTALAVGAGLMSGLAGMGRVPMAAFPKVADAITAVPRSAVISVINDMASDSRVERVVNKVTSDPLYFGPVAARRLDRAFRNPKVSISGVIDDLMTQKEFAAKYRELEK